MNGDEVRRFAVSADRPLVAANIAKMLRNCFHWRTTRDKRSGAGTPRVRIPDRDHTIPAMRARHGFVVRNRGRCDGLRRVQLQQSGRAPFGGTFFLSIACNGCDSEQSDGDGESDDPPGCGDFGFHI